MKIRNGFVSNSSSSSFVVYGHKFISTQSSKDMDQCDKLHEWVNEHNEYVFLNGSDDGLQEDNMVIGIKVCDIEDDQLSCEEIDIDEFKKKLKPIEKKLKQEKIEIGKAKLFTGTKMS